MRNLGPATGRNEANHLNPQLEVEGGEAAGHINFTIKKIIYTVNEELIAVTEGKQTKGLGGGVHAKRDATREFLPHEHKKKEGI
ncbi:unnamed protein product [Rhizophagus irregularis]|nr:unnamed protein product [Rhizophagus irregularis]CAB5382466.1 unnamed protein product [Rhizophagus irregularis]